MKKRRKAISSLLLAAAMVVSLTACGGGETNSSSEAAKTTNSASGTGESASGASVSQDTDITAAIQVDFTTMDPMDTSDTLSGGIQRMIMDGFFGFDEKMGILPMLATEYSSNDDATEFILKLREGISFTDGTPWNAAAAKANLDRWGDKTLGLKRTSLLCNILDKVEAVDDYTVKVTLTQPFGAFINTLAHPACVIVSPKVIELGSEACASTPIGTGQYKFVEWIAGESTKVELNKDWWGYNAEICGGTPLADKDAGFKTITFKPVPESATRVSMIQSGDAQIIWPVPTESMQVLESDKNVAIGKSEGIVVRFLTLNTQKEIFKDKRVRQAVNYALDKEAYVAVVKNGLASVATSVMGPATQFYKANEPYHYNIEKAKQLLTEAGYPNGLTFNMMYSNASSNEKQAEFYKQQLAQVGITVELVGLENAILNQRVQDVSDPGSEVEVDSYISGWSSSTGDADWALRPLLCKESEPPASFNTSYYENQEFDNEIYRGLATADPEIRAEAYAKAQDIAWEDSPIIAMANDFNTWATGTELINVSIAPDGAINIRNAKIVK